MQDKDFDKILGDKLNEPMDFGFEEADWQGMASMLQNPPPTGGAEGNIGSGLSGGFLKIVPFIVAGIITTGVIIYLNTDHTNNIPSNEPTTEVVTEGNTTHINQAPPIPNEMPQHNREEMATPVNIANETNEANAELPHTTSQNNTPSLANNHQKSNGSTPSEEEENTPNTTHNTPLVSQANRKENQSKTNNLSGKSQNTEGELFKNYDDSKKSTSTLPLNTTNTTQETTINISAESTASETTNAPQNKSNNTTFNQLNDQAIDALANVTNNTTSNQPEKNNTATRLKTPEETRNTENTLTNAENTPIDTARNDATNSLESLATPDSTATGATDSLSSEAVIIDTVGTVEDRLEGGKTFLKDAKLGLIGGYGWSLLEFEEEPDETSEGGFSFGIRAEAFLSNRLGITFDVEYHNTNFVDHYAEEDLLFVLNDLGVEEEDLEEVEFNALHLDQSSLQNTIGIKYQFFPNTSTAPYIGAGLKSYFTLSQIHSFYYQIDDEEGNELLEFNEKERDFFINSAFFNAGVTQQISNRFVGQFEGFYNLQIHEVGGFVPNRFGLKAALLFKF